MAKVSLKNPRITAKERGLIKGSIRRVFGRSDLRRQVIEAHIVKGYKDPKRKAVKFWVKCCGCGVMEAKSNVQIDHLEPVVPVDSSFELMSVDTVIDRMWCEEHKLQPLCLICHRKKTLEENRLRRLNKGSRPKKAA